VRHCRMWLPLRRQSIASTRRHDHVRPRMLLPAMPPRMRLTLVQVYLYIACMIYFCEVELAFSSPSRFFFPHSTSLFIPCVFAEFTHVCVYVWIYTHQVYRVYMYVYVYSQACMFTCMHDNVYVCMFTCTHTGLRCACMCLHLCRPSSHVNL
jgi:TRAP-type C4-dicarboxylate transport system permease small subunit